ncbi:protein translocase subunit SecY [Oxobacter pfennigii]|uniref:Protein translocase subunit SecY n=1 Tax=Oxobacter pfennigii TaxID=36849 RepID=A0A0P8WK52_9CLOT|nr:preprotein translocase subunit SecY [Oxobacter pfennigii]KPU42613.1 protein translocase subunit SecY [Oxobacter pfennigii]
MLSTLRNAWKIPDLRRRLIFVVIMLVVYRGGAFIPVPYINTDVVQQFVSQGALFGFFDILSGGAFKNFTIFAMGIVPYINSSIIINLLTIAIPKLEQMSKEGEDGRKKIAQITRYGTIVLGTIQAFGLTLLIRSQGAIIKDSPFHLFIIIITLVAGTSFLMWLGEQITDKGIGNGISLLIFTSIISRYPSMGFQISGLVSAGTADWFEVIIFIAFALISIIAVVTMDLAERRIPVQYAKKMVGRKMYGGQSTHIPISVSSSSVIAIIFAMSIMQFPATIAAFVPNAGWVSAFNKGGIFGTDSWLYIIIYFLLVIFFTWFYTGITFNTKEMAENMKKNGGFIPGIRPGKPTADYVQSILNRITLIGGTFAGIIALTPYFLDKFTGLKDLYFGGTSILIVVGTALELAKQLEAQMTMRHYQGFLK